jgi:hypothetical protein
VVFQPNGKNLKCAGKTCRAGLGTATLCEDEVIGVWPLQTMCVLQIRCVPRADLFTARLPGPGMLS